MLILGGRSKASQRYIAMVSREEPRGSYTVFHTGGLDRVSVAGSLAPRASWGAALKPLNSYKHLGA